MPATTRGFALCSMRNETLSRYYIQTPLDARPGDWSDDAFWDELRRRIPARGGRGSRDRPEHREIARPAPVLRG